MVKLGQASLLCSLFVHPPDNCCSKGDYCGVSFKEFFFPETRLPPYLEHSLMQDPGLAPGLLLSTMTLTHTWVPFGLPSPSYPSNRKEGRFESLLHSQGENASHLFHANRFFICLGPYVQKKAKATFWNFSAQLANGQY